jgi:hypothetical protein
MFSIDSVDFLNDPLSFGFNTTKQISLFLHVFDFQGPPRHQTDPIFLSCHFFQELEDHEKKSTGNAARRKREGTTRAHF